MLKPGFFLGIDAWAIVFVIMIMAFGLINLLHYFLKSQYLSSILVHAPSPWIIVNLKASRLDKLSHNFAKDFGLPTSERPTLDLVLSCFSNLSAFDFLKWLGEDNHENQVAEWLTKTINGKTYILKRIYLNTTLAFIWFEDQTTLAELKDALAQNQEQQHFIESILNELPFPVWCRDEKTHMLTFINNTYVDFVGQTKEAILAQQIDVYRASKNRISIDAQAKQHFIVDGSRVLFEFHETHDPYNNLIVGFGVDITPQEILQNELKQNISSNHELLEYLSTGIAIYSPDMRLKFFNHAYAKLTEPLGSFLHTEPTIGEVIEQLRRHRLLPEMTDFQSYKKRQMSLFTSISTPIHELSYLPNGQILRMIIAPYPLGGLIIMFEDITERISLESQYNTLIAVQK
ncbi:MAG: PAS-domain containing protein, partial [Alphaproteobacteria bacterium]|nr:PAS-domain containing protein [Alphaproteobacteria bacterium]